MCTNRSQKPTMLIILALLLLSLSASKISCSTLPGNSTDEHSLLAFKAAANDPTGVLNSWNSSTNHCLWKGIKCSLTHPGRVTALELSGNKLAGSISSSIANLTFLRTLDLSANSFSGELPPLYHLHKLEVLNLRMNYLLQGSVPDLTNCSNLKILDLSSNKLTGIIPTTLYSTTLLEWIDLSSNNLSGGIPSGFVNMPLISVLYLGQNSLSGGIPQDIFNRSSLRRLSLEMNMLTGTLPSDIGNTLPSLEKISVGGNKLEGKIPHSFGNASQLYFIDLSQNNFTGQIPSSLGKLSLLNYLNLEVNSLEARDNHSWEFINVLSNCRLLETLSVAANQLQGVIPSSIGNLSSELQYLNLGQNNLSGNIPHSIGNVRQLTNLLLNQNSLSGTVGDWIGNLTQLQELVLVENNFVGQIPSVIFTFSQLVILILANNEFEGSISSTIGNLQQLSVLDLSYNNLDGKIPLELSNLKQISELHLSSNNISGEIPDVLGQCQNLVIMEMAQNILTGNISKSLGNLRNLVTLNLSHNSLSGTIPTTLDGLLSLTVLDLSYNRLQGEIPTTGVFENNATAVSLMNNLGLCGGVMDLHMPVCPAVTRGTEWKHYLIILPTLVFAFMSLGMSIYIIFLGKKTSRRPYSLLLSFGKKFPRVSYNDIAQVTQNFSESNLIGKGSYGSVYRGKLNQTKIQVAIKVFDLNIRFADRSFVSECEALRIIRHRNLLPILTACSTIDNNGNEFKALIYEFMARGNLDTWLHQKRGGVAPKGLGLSQRISICVDVADALAYLHHDCGRPIVHCDLKPTNILLDDDMNAHLGDFGIASLVVDSRSTAAGHSGCSSSLAVTGTIGYIAPEYAQTVHATTYGDVYSFGVVLLEMLIGKRPTDPMFEGELSIISFAERNLPDQVIDIIDAHVQEECKGFNKAIVATENEAYRCVLSLLQVALACTLRLPRERMSMREVAINLHAIRKSYILSRSGRSSH